MINLNQSFRKKIDCKLITNKIKIIYEYTYQVRITYMYICIVYYNIFDIVYVSKLIHIKYILLINYSDRLPFFGLRVNSFKITSGSKYL